MDGSRGDNSSRIGGNLVSIFEMDLETEEDVDACLAEFVFLVRLRIYDKARHIAEHILWRHIDFFPVFAEIAALFILLEDTNAAADLVIDLAARRIVFVERDEQGYVQMVALFARGRLSSDTLLEFERKDEVEEDKIAQSDGGEDAHSLFQEVDYTSVAQIQNIEMRLHSVLTMGQYRNLDKVIAFASSHMETLIERDILREAIEILSFICLCFHHHKAQEMGIWNYYTQITTKLDQQWKEATENGKIQDVLLLQTSVKRALLIGLEGQLHLPPIDVDEIARNIDETRSVLFKMIADDKPSVSLIDSLHQSRRSHLHPPHWKERFDTEEHGVFVQAFEKEIYVLKSQKTMFIQCSKSETYVQVPERETYVQAPERETYVQAPERETYVQSPRGIVYIQGPGNKTYVQGPRQTVYVQGAEKETYIQSPDGPVYVQNPQTETHIIKPRGELHIYNPANEVHIHGSTAPTFLYDSSANIMVYGAREEIMLYNPKLDVHIHAPKGPVHLYQTDMSMGTYMVHDEEDDPAPPYEAEYRVPEIPEINQVFNKEQMVKTLDTVFGTVSQTLREIEKEKKAQVGHVAPVHAPPTRRASSQSPISQLSPSSPMGGIGTINSKKDFDKKVLQAKTPVVVNWFATWVGPYKTITPVIQKLSQTYTDVKFYQIDVDELSEVAAELSVHALPTFMLFKNGRKVTEVVGANPPALEAGVKNLIE